MMPEPLGNDMLALEQKAAEAARLLRLLANERRNHCTHSAAGAASHREHQASIEIGI